MIHSGGSISENLPVRFTYSVPCRLSSSFGRSALTVFASVAAAKALLAPQTLRDSIVGFLRYAVENATQKGSARGCLMMCVAPLVNDAEVQQFLQSAVAGGAALVERRFRDGISAGDIPPDFPVAVRAIQVTDFARALTMRALTGTPRKTLLKEAEEAADLVLLPRG